MASCLVRQFVASGVYFKRFRAGSTVLTKKAVSLKSELVYWSTDSRFLL